MVAIRDSKLFKLCRHLNTEEIIHRDESLTQQDWEWIQKVAGETEFHPDDNFGRLAVVVLFHGDPAEQIVGAPGIHGKRLDNNPVDVDEVYNDICDTYPDLDFSQHPLTAFMVALPGTLSVINNRLVRYSAITPMDDEVKSSLADLFALIAAFYNDPEKFTVCFRHKANDVFQPIAFWSTKR